MTINHDYEISSEGAVRHWEIPYSRLENATPTPTEAAAVTSVIVGTQLTGTVLSVDANDSIAVIDFTCSMVYEHNVRNVLTYNGGNEATWGPINIGDPVFYDGSATMPADVYLSTSPLDSTGASNPLFGHVVPASDADAFPKGAALVASTQVCAVMQIGAGG